MLPSARSTRTAALVLLAGLAIGCAAAARASGWRTDPAWHAGKAEWALYDATRTIYGQARSYEATIFTNKQLADPATGVKTDDPATPGAVEVFKHNLSEIVPTESYAYRFLTTGFARVDDLSPFLLSMSSQEDCGATYKRFFTSGRRVEADSFCYFPGAGHKTTSWRMPRDVAYHDLLSLTLRDYPFPAAGEAPPRPVVLPLLADQTNTRETPMEPAEATIAYGGLETLKLPYGTVEAHRLEVTHEPIGDATTSTYWFAADPAMRHVMVQYRGPWGVEYRLKRLAWWAYWSEPRP